MKKVIKKHFQYMIEKFNVKTKEEAIEIIQKYINRINENLPRNIEILEMYCGLHKDHLNEFLSYPELSKIFNVSTVMCRDVNIRLINKIKKMKDYDDNSSFLESLGLSSRAYNTVIRQMRTFNYYKDTVDTMLIDLIESGDIIKIKTVGPKMANEIIEKVNMKLGTSYELYK